MQQYLHLLEDIIRFGTNKPAAREGMPGSRSLFGYQLRHDLRTGFPLLTTKKMYWKGIVAELLWFLKGDTNIKYLVDNGVNIWNQDAYNYYLKKCKEEGFVMDFSIEDPDSPDGIYPLSFEEFISEIKNPKDILGFIRNYKFGDLPNQYGGVWRNFGGVEYGIEEMQDLQGIDQISNVIKSLKENPEGRRHIVTAINPAVEPALYWCHAMFQFNCRPLTLQQRYVYFLDTGASYPEKSFFDSEEDEMKYLDSRFVPRYYLDCQLYQRSADSILGVPFNIASYALLTHLVAKVCNMLPGDFIHTFGDVHIYDNHMEAAKEQLQREIRPLPQLKIFNYGDLSLDTCELLRIEDFQILNYNPHPKIDAELSTGLKKK